MRKSKKSLLLLILLCGICVWTIYSNIHVSKSSEPVTVGFFLGDVEETY